MTASQREHVLLLGFGAIGRHVAQLLQPEIEAGEISLTAAVRQVKKHEERGDLGVYLVEAGSTAWHNATASASVMVECAGIAPAESLGPEAIIRGKDLVLASVGALTKQTTRRKLLAGPGRLWVSHGAIGGFDTLESLAEARALDHVSIQTSKAPNSLVRPWMSAEQKAALRAMTSGDDPQVLFTGNPTGAIKKFPTNVNVSVALAWATRGLARAEDFPASRNADDELMAANIERVQVELVADPSLTDARHIVRASGVAGNFEFRFESTPSPMNPKTSGTTALSVVHTVRRVLKRNRLENR